MGTRSNRNRSRVRPAHRSSVGLDQLAVPTERSWSSEELAVLAGGRQHKRGSKQSITTRSRKSTVERGVKVTLPPILERLPEVEP